MQFITDLIGSMMIILSAGSVGVIFANSKMKELNELRILEEILLYMREKLQYDKTSLPELCRMVSKDFSGEIPCIFRELDTKLSNLETCNAEQSITEILNRYTYLPSSLRKCIHSLGRTLGKFDAAGQIASFNMVISQCSEMTLHLEREVTKNTKTYHVLGICTGAMLVILFL